MIDSIDEQKEMLQQLLKSREEVLMEQALPLHTRFPLKTEEQLLQLNEEITPENRNLYVSKSSDILMPKIVFFKLLIFLTLLTIQIFLYLLHQRLKPSNHYCIRRVYERILKTSLAPKLQQTIILKAFMGRNHLEYWKISTIFFWVRCANNALNEVKIKTLHFLRFYSCYQHIGHC